jgi:hypothetical protein
VASVFDGKRDDRQAFIELILHKRHKVDSAHSSIEKRPPERGTDNKVFFDIRIG